MLSGGETQNFGLFAALIDLIAGLDDIASRAHDMSQGAWEIWRELQTSLDLQAMKASGRSGAPLEAFFEALGGLLVDLAESCNDKGAANGD